MNQTILWVALLWAQGLELLVQNLSRLDETYEEDAKGVNTTMGVLENLLEVSNDRGFASVGVVCA